MQGKIHITCCTFLIVCTMSFLRAAMQTTICCSLFTPKVKMCAWRCVWNRSCIYSNLHYRYCMHSINFSGYVTCTENRKLIIFIFQYHKCVTRVFLSKINCFVCLFLQRYEKPLFSSESFHRVLEKHKKAFNTEQVITLMKKCFNTWNFPFWNNFRVLARESHFPVSVSDEHKVIIKIIHASFCTSQFY